MTERQSIDTRRTRIFGTANPDIPAAGCRRESAERPHRAAVRLRACEAPGALPAGGADLPWAALDALPAGEATLRVTLLVRPGERPEVELALAVAPGRPAPAARALARLAKAALPGCARIAPRLRPLPQAPMPLPAPGLPIPVLRAGSAYPGPGPAVPPARLHLPPKGALALDPGRALVTLARLGLEADLVLTVGRRPLAASDLRRIAEVRAALTDPAARTGGFNPFLERMADAQDAALGLWAAAPDLAHVEAALRLSGPAGPEVPAAVAAALFGAAAAPAHPGALDLSAALRPTDPRPPLVPDPASLALASDLLVARRRPRPGPDALELGRDEAGRTVGLPPADLAQHLYVLGATGTGKTSLLRALILQGAAAGVPHVVIDPHGDLYAELRDKLMWLHPHRLTLADATDFRRPFTLNILEAGGPHAAIRQNFVANQMIRLFKLVYGNNPEAFGPIFEAYWRGAVMLLMQAGGEEASLLNLDRVFGDNAYRKTLLERCTDPQLVGFWKHVVQRAGGEASLENIAPYIVSKVTQIAGNPLLRPILCAPRSSLDFDRALAEGRTVLINLGRGVVGGPDAALLGGVLTIKLFAAAMARAQLPLAQRRPVRVVMDEFPTYASAVLAEALAEVRKYGLQLILANQGLGQIDGRGADIGHAVLANAASLCAFRLGAEDADTIARTLGDEELAGPLMRLPNGRCLARLMQDGAPQPPLVIDSWARRG